MIDSQLITLYEDSDDVINASLKSVISCVRESNIGQKRRCESEILSDVPDLETDTSLDESDNDTIGFSKCNRLKRLKRQREHRMPDCVAKQTLFEKNTLTDVACVIDDLACIGGGDCKESRMELTVGLPVLLFLFTPSQIESLCFFDQLNGLTTISVVAVTPDFPFRNEHSFPIVLDRSGKLAKVLRVRDPLGGGIYPIPTVIVFDRHGEEVVRVQLGYDYQVYYDSSIENNLQTVLIDCINYTNTL
ncbi:hypothetical protein CANINC_001161 [Pichia inconspicua]|uniref:Uncharacterized protein n=1 Tax=Pichia inconspicua TaxID=52247 RepID=A0A4T0X4B5_9ASCO|nr:hypothetical protein CANINC_001161 [[Candida] inconspicua]